MTDRERLRRIRRLVVRRLGEIERERVKLVRDGRRVQARQALRAFQELAQLLEGIDEVLTT